MTKVDVSADNAGDDANGRVRKSEYDASENLREGGNKYDVLALDREERALTPTIDEFR